MTTKKNAGAEAQTTNVTVMTGSGGGGGGAGEVHLPSEHVVHSQVFVSELNGRLHAFETAIMTLEGEKEGQVAKHNASVAELTAGHDASVKELDRRIADMQRGREMALAALQVGEQTKSMAPVRQ